MDILLNTNLDMAPVIAYLAEDLPKYADSVRVSVTLHAEEEGDLHSAGPWNGASAESFAYRLARDVQDHDCLLFEYIHNLPEGCPAVVAYSLVHTLGTGIGRHIRAYVEREKAMADRGNSGQGPVTYDITSGTAITIEAVPEEDD